MIGTEPIEPSLEVLLTQIGRSDRDSFQELYRRTSVKLFGVCLRILLDRTEAEDALQAVYISIWRNAVSFDTTRGTPMTWLLTLARNGAVDRLRSTRSLVGLPIEMVQEFPDPAPLASESVIAADDQRRLHECLGQLDAFDTSLIGAAFFEGSTYAELAERAALPLATIKSRIRRALLKLRDCVQ